MENYRKLSEEKKVYKNKIDESRRTKENITLHSGGSFEILLTRSLLNHSMYA